MSDTLMFKGTMPDGRSVRVRAGQALKAAAAFWFAVMVAGQAIFVAYIASFYGGAVAAGDWMRFNKVLPVGYVPGDRVGNAALAAHLAIAALVTLAGPLQLIPALRARFPAFHRWNGRVYVTVAVVTAIAGAYMVWTRNAAGDMTQHWGTTLDAVLIMLCAVLAVRHARARRLDLHRRWALRLFLVVSGSWFFRVGLLFWLLVNGGPVGFDPKTFTGPALNLLVFGESLLPLTLLELYLRARAGGGARKLAAAAGLTLLTLAMGVGIVGASMAMWLPHISFLP
ncbi:DUF2306 domain-containing protein [Duganella violaceipulchra]|uniref:DUF2306 domain-containing protein n=1 Tax=Duganella violaceipulchra TaxID=2849652 RepID=A0AA41HA73_9BURK|nr:DUF2306 domain-containing protein [Duganella violaceicalia]MBV6321062.1 DUF2306 domain-containing protein [Duganella violaceicalia]MCP2009692.1 putative membrane protein [Duganella violaceicalia]